MQSLEFEQLCHDASDRLGLPDADALGHGVAVSFGGVSFETAFTDGQNAFLLMADLGIASPQDKASVYERLLAMQLVAWDEPRLRFGVHPIRETAVLCVEARLDQQPDAEKLAGLLRSVTRHIKHWRTTHFGPLPMA